MRGSPSPTVATPYQPIFTGLAAIFMGFAFHRLYVQPRRCEKGEACEIPRVLRRQRIAFWVATAIIALMAAFPLFASYFY